MDTQIARRHLNRRREFTRFACQFHHGQEASMSRSSRRVRLGKKRISGLNSRKDTYMVLGSLSLVEHSQTNSEKYLRPWLLRKKREPWNPFKRYARLRSTGPSHYAHRSLAIPAEHRRERRPEPPSGTTSLWLLHGYGNVVEGRDDRLKRLDSRRSIDHIPQCLQHFRVGAGVVIVCIVLVIPQTD